ncbi:MAG: DUF3472 domain-containing protein, partial [Ferruginibacter sp.]|nr:DUF3472 domain-containing protein [Chitinophagaceae bacterium]
MKRCLPLILLFIGSIRAGAMDKDSTTTYILPDSIKAVQFMAEINIQAINGKKEVLAGIKTDVVQLAFKAGKRRVVVFDFPASAILMAKGLNAEAGSDRIEFEYNWATNETYKLMISMARDSAENFSLYSGYAWLAMENKWKLVGTCKIQGRWNTIQDPATFFSSEKKEGIQVSMGGVWCQGSNGSWKNMKED